MVGCAQLRASFSRNHLPGLAQSNHLVVPELRRNYVPFVGLPSNDGHSNGLLMVRNDQRAGDLRDTLLRNRGFISEPIDRVLRSAAACPSSGTIRDQGTGLQP